MVNSMFVRARGFRRGIDAPDLNATATLDDDLLLRARIDVDAFGVFYHRTFDDIVAYFHKRVFDRELAADLCAETFAELLRNLRRFDPARGSARQYLFGIARNQYLMWQRKGVVSHRSRRAAGMAELPPWRGDEETLVDRLDAQRLSKPIRTAMDALAPGERAAVERRVIDGLPYCDVAQSLGCSEVAARVRVSRGLAKLAKSLEHTAGEPS